MNAARIYSLLYVLGAAVVGAIRFASDDPLPWLIVCASAVGLGMWSALRRPATLLCAAHAGLTATWAGTLAPKTFFTQPRYVQPQTFFELLALCAGMTVLIGLGLKAQPRIVAPPPQS